MRNMLGGLVAAVWLLASVLLWAGVVQVVPPPSASHAIGLSLSQSVLLAYHLSGVLQALTGAYLSLAFAGLLSSVWLLSEGLVRRIRLAAALGGAVVAIEIALGLFTLLRIRLSLPMRPNAAGLLAGASIAGQMAVEMIPAALLLVLVLGAILIAGRRASKQAGAPPQAGRRTVAGDVAPASRATKASPSGLQQDTGAAGGPDQPAAQDGGTDPEEGHRP